MSDQITEEQAIDLLQASGWLQQHDLEMTLSGMRMCRDFLAKSRHVRKWEHLGNGLYVCPSCMGTVTRHYEWKYCPYCGEDCRGERRKADET